MTLKLILSLKYHRTTSPHILKKIIGTHVHTYTQNKKINMVELKLDTVVLPKAEKIGLKQPRFL